MKLYIIGFLFALSIDSSYAQQQEGTGLRITKLSDNFFAYTTWKNYEGEPYPANGMYVITNAGAIMVDCPWDSTQWQPLLDSIEVKHGKQVVMVFATHFHDDRTVGLIFIGKRKLQPGHQQKPNRFVFQGMKSKRKMFLIKTPYLMWVESLLRFITRAKAIAAIILCFGLVKKKYCMAAV